MKALLRLLRDPDDSPHVRIFKSTGEKQCGQSPGISIQDMTKVLTRHHIYVIESHTQPDGLMHMVLCGAPSGKIHVFTISRKDLKRALRLDFKVFKSRQ